MCCYHLVAKSCLTLCNHMDYSPPGSSVHRISQARILQWVAISSSRSFSKSRDQTWISCIGRWMLSCTLNSYGFVNSLVSAGWFSLELSHAITISSALGLKSSEGLSGLILQNGFSTHMSDTLAQNTGTAGSYLIVFLFLSMKPRYRASLGFLTAWSSLLGN